MRSTIATLAVAFGMAATSASAATVIYSETFDDEAAANGSVLNFTDFTPPLTVTEGTVDLVSHGGFGLPCRGGAGGCVDVDGSTLNAGTLDAGFLFEAGVEYALSFWVNGNMRTSVPDVLDYSIDGLTAVFSLVIGQFDPYTKVELNFVGDGATHSLLFAAAGGDNFGPLLDDILIQTVDPVDPGVIPLPAGLPLLVGGLAMLGLVRRRSA